MNIKEYMDRGKFPATTQDGLDEKDQLMIDAFNYDQLKGFLEDGGKPDDEQKAIWNELKQKMQSNAKLIREIAVKGLTNTSPDLVGDPVAVDEEESVRETPKPEPKKVSPSPLKSLRRKKPR